MSVVTLPPFTSRKQRRAWVVLALALFLGLLSLAAVRVTRIDCRDVYLTGDDGRFLTSDAGTPLTADQQQCQLDLGEIRVPLPAWAQAIINQVDW